MDGYPQVTSATNGWMPTLHYAHVAIFDVAVAASPVLVMCDGKPYELALIRTSCPEGSLHSYAIKCMLVQWCAHYTQVHTKCDTMTKL